MIIYFKQTAVEPTPTQTIINPTPLTTFQTWYGRTNYWMTDLSITESELVACKNNGISGYMISLDPWNNSFSMTNVDTIVNNFETMLKLCQSLGLWLVVSIGNASTNGYNLNNLRFIPKVIITDEEDYGSGATANISVNSSGEVSLTLVNGGSNYRTPIVSISPSPTGKNATATATISNGVVTSINVSNKGSGYNTYLNNNVTYYTNIINKIKNKVTNGLKLNNLIIQPISNMNDDEQSSYDIVDLITNTLTSSNLMYNGNNGNPDKIEVPAPYKIQAFHPSSYSETSELYDGAAIISTPINQTSAYNDMLEVELTFTKESKFNPYYILLSDPSGDALGDGTSYITRLNKIFISEDYGGKYYTNTLGSIKFSVIERNESFRVCQDEHDPEYGDVQVCSDRSITNFGLVTDKLFSTTPGEDLPWYSIAPVEGTQYYQFILGDGERTNPTRYYKTGKSYSFGLQKTHDEIDTLYTKVNYSDTNNETSINNLSLWIARCKAAGAKIVGYDSFYRKSSEKRIFSTLNASNY